MKNTLLAFLLGFSFISNAQQVITCDEAMIQNHNFPGNVKMLTDECLEIEYTVYVDYLYYQAFNGDTSDIINTIESTVLLTNSDLATFNLQLTIVDIIISKNASDDWWLDSIPSSITNLLSQFSSNVVGFSTTNDLVGLNTGFNLSGSTIGVAYVGSVCGIYPTHVLENFNDNLNMRRNLLTHEIGHNLSAGHTAGAWIMSPSVNGSTNWSSNSITAISDHIAGLTCFGDCQLQNPCEITGYDTVWVDVYDTNVVNINVYDTNVVNINVYDTNVVNINVYDTNVVNINVYDTIRNIVEIDVVQYDTIYEYVELEIVDTIIVTYHDTVWILDTLYLTDTICDFTTGFKPQPSYNQTNTNQGVYDLLGRELSAIRSTGYYIINGKLYYVGF